MPTEIEIAEKQNAKLHDELMVAQARILNLEAQVERHRNVLVGVVDHWWEFGDMMIENKDDYGFGKRIDGAAKLVK
jgi:hypothetical protein